MAARGARKAGTTVPEQGARAGSVGRSLKTEERTRERVRATARKFLPAWSCETKRTVNIRVVLAPSDGASASSSRIPLECEASLSEGVIASAMALDISTESLILAQDERWRRA